MYIDMSHDHALTAENIELSTKDTMHALWPGNNVNMCQIKIYSMHHIHVQTSLNVDLISILCINPS